MGKNESKNKTDNKKMKIFERGKLFGTWQIKMLLIAWVTYASFYLLRVNYSVAIPVIQAEFGFSKTDVGIIATSLLLAYAVGQFINGQLGDKFRARRIIALGLITSAILNVLFGFSGLFFIGVTFIWVMATIWALNGYFQSPVSP